MSMRVIQIETPNSDRALPVLQDAIERQVRLLSESIVRSEAKAKELAEKLNVDCQTLVDGKIPHPDSEDVELLELEGELEMLQELREQLDSLQRVKIQ